MNDGSRRPTAQEEFWAGEFGTSYIERNRGPQLLASNLQFFSQALRRAEAVGSCVELGANIGMNLRALQLLYPGLQCHGIEINSSAAQELGALIGEPNVFNGSITEWQPSAPVHLSLVKGVLIHLNPDVLPLAYDKLHAAASRYVLIAEYYNPSPVAVGYRGHEERLFKRDFAGEMLERHHDLHLVDYGFTYRRDPAFPQDDITWFLLQKEGR